MLTSNQFARRWRLCHNSNEPPLADEDERSWRKRNLELLAQAHTLGGIKDLNFVTTEPRYGASPDGFFLTAFQANHHPLKDFAFELEGEGLKWRWEGVSLGHKLSAEILSQHLIIPLISVTHLAFSSADPVSELSESDLEKVRRPRLEILMHADCLNISPMASGRRQNGAQCQTNIGNPRQARHLQTSCRHHDAAHDGCGQLSPGPSCVSCSNRGIVMSTPRGKKM